MNNDLSINALKQKLEREIQQKLQQLYQQKTPIQDLEKTLLKIVEDGGKEFKQKTGREMTYAEMRSTYG